MNYRKLLDLPQKALASLHVSHAGWFALAALLPLTGAATAFAVSTDASAPLPPVETLTETLALPAFTIPAPSGARYWRADTIQRGDTLSSVMQRQGVSAGETMRFLAKGKIGRELLSLPAGATLHIETNDSGELFAIRYLRDDRNGEQNLVSIRKNGQGDWGISADAVETAAIETPRAIRISDSFAASSRRAGLPGDVRTQLQEIFGDQVNLGTLKSGDSVDVVYETLYFDGEDMGAGRVLGAEVRRGDQRWSAFYFAHDAESGSYYNAAGKALKKGFDARPVDGARVSSGFGFRRHPILRSIRKHAGIDYAASSGTPIRAAADGKVLDVRRDGGYGNVITLRHANRYDTVYAHMSRFGKFKAGQTVKAGDIIGYVGSTGRSTGPHLHFELRVAGTPVDPTVHALPTPSLSVAQLGKFRTQNVAFQQQMNVVAKLPEGSVLARID
ncbi:M23 family metallopeptidase [Laribacter hongkongensis]|uniref:M23 family metallopeptidase n=1 Tax=Laribacter hongkongensis TaxID=168471 RepID=UPI001EFC9EF6|nr:M23 family metallopeptidase [Laribacter hongkongensis]MCG9051836.1 M23 family metallopeptidase [Laribacter hongkongensis]